MAPNAGDLINDEPPTIDPYKVLKIGKEATNDEVKSAYRKAALKHHPGTTHGSILNVPFQALSTLLFFKIAPSLYPVLNKSSSRQST